MNDPAHIADPEVSVIIPAYNAASTIRQTLKSVAAQTFRSFEVIVVDDGSTDATAKIVEKFVQQDPRFLLIQQSNGGVGAARNAALRIARGRYIAPLDADDLWSPLKLEKQVALMEATSDRTGMVYCWSTRINARGRFLYAYSPEATAGQVRRALLVRNFIGNASVPLFRAATLRAVGPYLTRAEQGGAQGCEDWDLLLRIAERSEAAVVPKYLVQYRNTASCMSADTRNMIASRHVAMQRARQRNPDLAPALFRSSAGNFHLYIMGTCHQGGNPWGALRSAWTAATADPMTLLNPLLRRTVLRSVFHLLTHRRVSIISIHTQPAFRPARP